MPPVISAAEPTVFGVPVEFIFFALTLLGIAVFHHHTLRVSLIGLAAIAIYKIAFTGFAQGRGIGGFVAHLAHEWVILANLLLLLMGFALLSRHFEKSRVPNLLPRYLPHGWAGGFTLLVIVWVLSSFLDNIAGALIGGAMAHQLFRAKVHVGYIAAIVAASNAGGAWSVLGDTTTTMMWIAGVAPSQVFEAIIPAVVALFVFGLPAAIQQHRYAPMIAHAHEHTRIDWARVGIVGFILALALATNLAVNTRFPHHAERFPFLGVAVWVAIAASIVIRRPDWELLPRSFRGSLFLLALVLCASMLPVEKLPTASWQTAFGLGFVSAVFDNIPLTAVAIKQGGYDWGFLAYAVGFGGSMIWFGSSSGVALANMYPETRSVVRWVRRGWHIPLAYLASFAVMLLTVKWHSETPRTQTARTAAPHEMRAQ